MAVGLYSGVSGLALGVGLYRGNSGLWGGASGLINGFGGSGPFPGASLYLDFLTPPLDPRITFSRGSNATLVDATGKITYAPANLLRYSEQLDNGSAWTNVSGATVTANTSVAPDGTTTADTVNFSVTNANRVEQLSGTAGNGETVIFSIWLRGSGSMRINVGTDTGVGGSSEPTINLTSTWTRYTATVTYSAPTGNRRAMIIWRTGDTATSVEAWGAQLEQVTYQTTPSTYVATTASAYYGPRFDYDPVTLAPKGLLIEDQRANLLTYSEQFDNAAWVKSSATITANATTSPDGTTNADRLIPTAAATDGRAALSFTGSIGATYTLTVYGKADAFSNIRLYSDDGTTNVASVSYSLSTGLVTTALNVTGTWTNGATTVTAVGNGWYRLSLTWTATGVAPTRAAIWCRDTGNGTSGIFIYGAQLEAGSFATSYIPTVASTVTRSADVATMTGTNFSSWYNQTEGTFVVNASVLNTAGGAFTRIVEANDGNSNNAISILKFSTNPQIYTNVNVGGVAQMTLFGSATLTTAPFKAATAYQLNNFAFGFNGEAPTTDASGTIPTVNRLNIGYDGSFSQMYGHIRSLAYYNTRLPNAQLQTLTAPSLATTLTMSFTDQAYTVGV